MNIQQKWQTPENQELLKSLIERFGKYKYIQIIGYDGEKKYFKVTTKRIITQGIKAQELLTNKYGKEIKEKEYKKSVQEQKTALV